MNPCLCDQLAAACGQDPIIAEILIRRNIKTPQAARSFLSADQPLYDPFLFDQMEKVCDRVEKAIAGKESILIVGDSDADGITATAILLDYLRSRGARVSCAIPASSEVSAFWREGNAQADLILTVDCGISFGEAELSPYARRGCDIIISDHHECRKALPLAYAVINPKWKKEGYPFSDLSGAGVALKIVCALAGRRGREEEALDRYCDLAAIGTVADAMPLVEENRCLVRRGLDRMQSSRRVGIDLLLRAAGANLRRPITASAVGFVIAPRLNAAGRAGMSDCAIRLLTADSAAEARPLVDTLSQLNRERQKTEGVCLKEALARVRENDPGPEPAFLMLSVHDWPTGMPGIIASRLMDIYHCPCVVVSFSGGCGRGSGRSLKGFDMYSALQKNSALLSDFGGHELAAGFTVREENFPALQEALRARAERLKPVSQPTREPDAIVLSPERVDLDLARSLRVLEPYGNGNPQPLFWLKNIVLEDILPLANPRHLRLFLRAGERVFEGRSFGKSVRELRCTAGDRVDLLFALDHNVDENGEQLQWIVRDLRPAAGSLSAEFRSETAAFLLGERAALPREAIPGKTDIIEVYSYLLRLSPQSSEPIVCFPDVLARRIARSFDRDFNLPKLLLSIRVLREVGMVSFEESGESLRIHVSKSSGKKNLSESALWLRLKDEYGL